MNHSACLELEAQIVTLESATEICSLVKIAVAVGFIEIKNENSHVSK